MVRYEFGRLALASALMAVSVVAATPSYALTAKECSTKYKAAKAAGSLGSKTWNDFRKQDCGSATSAAAPAADKSAPAKTTADTNKPVIKPVATGNALFPKAIDPKYAKETAGKQRFHTCLDQYHANKATNANGGMKWVEKGGGYYSKCSAALKS